jgi:hypothetical protein
MSNSPRFTETELAAYLDEALPIERMAEIEQAVRQQPELLSELGAIHARRDAGDHSLGEVWRRHRLSCPTREQLGSYLLGALEDELADYITFHLEKVACRYCQANLADLRAQDAGEPAAESRRRKYFQSSAGHLRRK